MNSLWKNLEKNMHLAHCPAPVAFLAGNAPDYLAFDANSTPVTSMFHDWGQRSDKTFCSSVTFFHREISLSDLETHLLPILPSHPVRPPTRLTPVTPLGPRITAY